MNNSFSVIGWSLIVFLLIILSFVGGFGIGIRVQSEATVVGALNAEEEALLIEVAEELLDEVLRLRTEISEYSCRMVI